MPVKTVEIDASLAFNSNIEDCMVLRLSGQFEHLVEIAFPFHEDTPNFRLSIPQALSLRNAIDDLIKVNFIEVPKEDI